VKDFEGRHPATLALTRFFTYYHLSGRRQRDVAELCHDLAEAMVDLLPDSPELTAGLRKLLEAKDCFVRASL